MGEHIRLQFRPGLIIFVGEAGARVRHYFNQDTLLAYLDTPLRQSVSILQVTSDRPDQAEPVLIESPSADDPDMPTQAGDLEDIIYRSLVSVQLDRRRLAVNSVGYSVPNPRTQVYIVGELGDVTTQRLMAKVLRTVREQIRKNRFDTIVSYFFNCYRLPQENYVNTLTKKLDVRGLKWSDYEIANMSYLFEPLMPYPSPTFVSSEEIRYATAESLLALTATGIMSWPNFESEMRLPPNLENYANYIGGLSTSMVRFPRIVARQYCSAQLSAELVQKWHDDLYRSTMSERQRTGLQAGAKNLGRRIASWIKDGEERPGAEESLWPGLGVLRHHDDAEAGVVRPGQLEAFTLLRDRSINLFNSLSYESLEKRYNRQVRQNHTWGALAYERFGKAADLFETWKQQAKKTWNAASDRICDEITNTVDDLWSISDSGLKQATTYVVELNIELSKLSEGITEWRQRHEDIYREERKRFLEISEGAAWSIDLNEPNIQHASLARTGQARPTMGGRGMVLNTAYNNTVSATDTTTSRGSSFTGGTAGLRVGHYSPTELEERISGNLARRADWKQKQIPSFQSLFAVCFIGWLVIVLTASQFPLSFITLLIVQVFVALAHICAALLLRRRRTQEFIGAREDLLAFYRLYYIKCCQQREDFERIDMIKTLRDKVWRIRERLENMHAFLMKVQQNAQATSERVKNDLFDGPPGVRDIFISNGERLEKHGLHTLDTLAKQVSQARKDHPLEAHLWHQSLEDIKKELIATFRRSSESLIEMTEERTEQHIHTFTANIVEGYLTGALVDISAALDKPEIWRELLDRVGKPMYDAKVGVREPRYLFVCGSAQDLVRSKRYIPDEAITVQTKSTEWLLVTAFFRGGEPATVNADMLFYPKLSPVSTKNTPAPAPNVSQSSGSKSVFDDEDATQPRKNKP